jgi:hypothetical protein
MKSSTAPLGGVENAATGTNTSPRAGKVVTMPKDDCHNSTISSAHLESLSLQHPSRPRGSSLSSNVFVSGTSNGLPEKPQLEIPPKFKEQGEVSPSSPGHVAPLCTSVPPVASIGKTSHSLHQPQSHFSPTEVEFLLSFLPPHERHAFLWTHPQLPCIDPTTDFHKQMIPADLAFSPPPPAYE